jgi:hypothetical protein
MRLRPARRNENDPCRHPRVEPALSLSKGAGPVPCRGGSRTAPTSLSREWGDSQEGVESAGSCPTDKKMGKAPTFGPQFQQLTRRRQYGSLLYFACAEGTVMPVGTGPKPLPRMRNIVAWQKLGHFVALGSSASIPGERAITEFLWLQGKIPRSTFAKITRCRSFPRKRRRGGSRTAPTWTWTPALRQAQGRLYAGVTATAILISLSRPQADVHPR